MEGWSDKPVADAAAIAVQTASDLKSRTIPCSVYLKRFHLILVRMTLQLTLSVLRLLLSVYIFIENLSKETETCINSTAFYTSLFCLEVRINSTIVLLDTIDAGLLTAGVAYPSNTEMFDPLDNLRASSSTSASNVGPEAGTSPCRLPKFDVQIAATRRILVTCDGARRRTIPGRTPTTHVCGVLSPEDIMCSNLTSNVNDIGSMTLVDTSTYISSSLFLDDSLTELIVNDKSFIWSFKMIDLRIHSVCMSATVKPFQHSRGEGLCSVRKIESTKVTNQHCRMGGRAALGNYENGHRNVTINLPFLFLLILSIPSIHNGR